MHPMALAQRRQTIRRATPARPPRAGDRTRGFTLVELIAVMVIAAVLAAIAVPAMTRAASLRASVAANTLLNDLAYARERALVTGVVCWVDFSLPDSWAVLAENPASPGRAGATPVLDPVTNAPLVRDLAQEHFVGVALAALNIRSGSSLAFDPLGRPLDASGSPLSSPASVTFSSTHRIDIAPNTGHLTITYP